MDNELISIIINVYNGEKYIKKCLDSIINQTYKNLDILIINDGSTDNTLSIIKKYKDKRIRIITTKNQGLSLSRNKGIENIKGDYIYFIDADDFIEKDTIEYLYYLLKKHSASMSYSNTLDIYNYDYKKNNDKEVISLFNDKVFIKKVLLSIDRSGTIWNKLFKKEIFNKIRFEDRIINDMAVMYKIALNLDKVIYSNQIKYYYLKNQDSITGKHNSDRAIDQYKVARERYDYINKKYVAMPENKIGLLHSIVMVYNHNEKEIDNYLDMVNARKLFKKLFSFKEIISCNIKKKEKIKIILYRINPILERIIQNKYNKRKKIK